MAASTKDQTDVVAAFVRLYVFLAQYLDRCFDEAARNGAALPTARQVDGFYAEIEAMGGRRWDTSSLFARLEAKDRG